MNFFNFSKYICFCTAPTIAPFNITGFNISSTTINISWSAIPKEYTRGPIGSYIVRYGLAAQNNTKSVDATTTLLEGLQEYSIYSIAVCGVSIQNHEGPCNSISVRTDEGGT